MVNRRGKNEWPGDLHLTLDSLVVFNFSQLTNDFISVGMRYKYNFLLWIRDEIAKQTED